MSKEIRELINEAFKRVLKESYNDVEKMLLKPEESIADYFKKEKKLSDYTDYDDKVVIDGNTYLHFKDNSKKFGWHLWGDILAFDNSDETEIARASYGKNTEYSYMEPTIDVRPDKRRKGIASNIYNWIEKLTNEKLYPSYPHTEHAELLWSNPKRKFGYDKDFIKENSDNEVKKLQKKLKEIDDWFYNKGKGKGDRTEEQWEEKKEEASKIRQRLFALTGDSYGETKEDKEKKNKVPEGLDSKYNSPEDVPLEVYRYIFKHKPLLTSDATDAVRWSRIINSRNEQRYPSMETTIYRAVDNRDYDEIREGDWVTTDEKYAIQHNNKYFDGQGKVISMVVDGRDVLVSPTGNSEEAIYAPLKYSIDVKI